MKKLINELKESRYTLIAILGFLFLMILIAIIYNLVMPKTGEPVYGNRLEGIEEVEIKKEDQKELEEKFEKNTIVEQAKVNISWKTVNAIVTVKEKTSVDNAKKLTKELTSFLSKEQIAFYDLQIFIKCEDKDNKKFPIIGYKNIKSEAFSFSYSK